MLLAKLRKLFRCCLFAKDGDYAEAQRAFDGGAGLIARPSKPQVKRDFVFTCDKLTMVAD